MTLAFDEIRQYGASSVQVIRRLRSALLGLAESVTDAERTELVQRYLQHLNLAVEHSVLDAEDRLMALQEELAGLGSVAPSGRNLERRGYPALTNHRARCTPKGT